MSPVVEGPVAVEAARMAGNLDAVRDETHIGRVTTEGGDAMRILGRHAVTVPVNVHQTHWRYAYGLLDVAIERL